MRSHKFLRLFAAGLALLIAGSLTLTACDTSPDDNTAARYVPADAEGFMSVALSPSIKQKARLLELSQHLPSSVRADKADGVRDKLINDLIKDNGLTFDADVKPWLGGEAAAALLKPYDNGTEPLSVAFLKSKDDIKAKETLDKKKVDAGSYRFIKGYLVLIDNKDVKEHQGAKALDAIDAVSKGGASLQDTDRYKKSLDSLHGEHLALGWFDLPAIMTTTKASDKAGDLLGSIGASAVKTASGDSADTSAASTDTKNKITDSINEVGALAVEIYATGDSVVLQAVTEHEPKAGVKTSNGDLIKHLPADTLAGLDIANVDELIKPYMDSAKKDTPNPSAVQKAGLDLADQLSGEAVISVGSASKVADLPVGMISAVKDSGAAQKALDAVADNFKNQGADVKTVTIPGGTAYTLTQGGVSATDTQLYADAGVTPPASTATEFLSIGISNGHLVASNKIDYLKTIAQAASPDLGGSAEYKQAFGDTVRPIGGQFFIALQGAIKLEKDYASAGSDAAAKFSAVGSEIDGTPATTTTTKPPTADQQAWMDSLYVSGAQGWNENGHVYAEIRLGFK